MDLLGNWKSIAQDENGDGTFATGETSTRTHDAQNQLTSLGATTASGGTPEYVRAYDKNGNLVSETIEGDTKPVRKFIYDAWNRLVRVERGPGGNIEPSAVAAYTYNALNWRVTERVRWPGDADDSAPGYTRTRVFFFSSDWQVLDALEDRHAPTASAAISTFAPDSETQFIWGVRDKDELLEVRTRALTNSSGTVIDPVTSWTDTAVNTIYALSDAQMSVAGYVNSSGRMREARVYDSYGRMTRTLPGDLNGDGVCDDADYLIFDASYNVLDCSSANMPGRNVGEGPLGGGYAPTWGCPADLNGDWIVDDADFNIFAASYNQLVPEVDTLTSGNANGGALEWGPGWNGYWFDPATGLWLSRNRWYDPEGGRWITRDPAGYVDGLSLYLYVKGNPFLFRDPSGLYSWSEWGQIGRAFVSGGVDGYVDLHAATGRLVKAAAIEGAAVVADVATTAYAVATNDQDTLAAPAYSATMESQSSGTFSENTVGIMKNAVAAPVVAPYEATKDFFSAGVNSYETGEPMGDATVGFVTTTLPAVGGTVSAVKSGFQLAKNFAKSLGRSEAGTLADAAGGMCFVAGTTVWTPEGAIPIEQIKVGQRVWTMGDGSFLDTPIEPGEWRCFEVELVGSADRIGRLQILRSARWAEQNQIEDDRSGLWIRLSIPEWKIEGRARVISILPCPKIQSGPGRIVLMTSTTRYAGEMARLKLVGSDQDIEGTYGHPIFSVDRNTYVPLGELLPGEHVRTADGWAIVESLARSWGANAVHNLEVQDDHRYFVGEARIESHNAGTCGETSHTVRGREAHNNYQHAVGPGYDPKVVLPSGKKPDAVNFQTRDVRELKPDNPKAIRQGQRQVDAYKQELENMTGSSWSCGVDTYKK